MQKASSLDALRKKMAQEHHFDQEPDPKKVAERNRRLEDQWRKTILDRQVYRWLKKSLWSGNRPMSFSFAQWHPDEHNDPELASEIGNQAWMITNRMKESDFNVLMTGDPGTGKTSLSLAIADKLWKDEQREYVFISTMAVSRLMNDRFHDDGESEYRLERLQKDAIKAKLLILDDFGTEAGMKIYNENTGKTHFKPVRKDMQEWMFQLADARLDEFTNSHRGSTIVTTNNKLSDLVQMYNPKLISRLITKRKENTIDFKGLDDMRG